jgi:hypothetical protein
MGWKSDFHKSNGTVTDPKNEQPLSSQGEAYSPGPDQGSMALTDYPKTI